MQSSQKALHCDGTVQQQFRLISVACLYNECLSHVHAHGAHV